MKIKFFETSAKSCLGVDDAFIALARDAVKNVPVEKPPENETVSVDQSKDKNKKKKGCC